MTPKQKKQLMIVGGAVILAGLLIKKNYMQVDKRTGAMQVVRKPMLVFLLDKVQGKAAPIPAGNTPGMLTGQSFVQQIPM